LSEWPITKSKGKIVMAINTSIVGSPSETQTVVNNAALLQSPKAKRGFAALDPVAVRELARKGGIAAHRVGTAHEFSSEEARAAGRKGGLASHSGAIRPNVQSEPV
jgi:general stress protein YciG